MSGVTASGQFDDASDDEDALFVSSMLKRMQMEATSNSSSSGHDGVMTMNPSDKHSTNNNSNKATIVVSVEKKKKEEEEEKDKKEPEHDEYFDDNEDDYDYDDDYDNNGYYYAGEDGSHSVISHKHSSSSSSMSVSSHRINLGAKSAGGSSSSTTTSVSHTISNSMARHDAKQKRQRQKHTGRDDRATTEQVMDPRTRLIVFKLLSTGFLGQIDGCLSTGKEANVYYATPGSSSSSSISSGTTTIKEYALKIFKTSILVFRDRDRYVSGEHRWRRGYCRSNPRKMVQTWAEKEYRNYRRLHKHGLPCPEPVGLKGHVLIMEFLGTGDGWPSPRLKDVTLSARRRRQALVETVLILRRMYVRCKLVHGDFSEYNLLWHERRVFVIDVSQSVETDHPRALEFLRQDCRNVKDFFGKFHKYGAGDDQDDDAATPVPTTRQLFAFVTDMSGVGNVNNNNDNDTNNHYYDEADAAALERLMDQVARDHAPDRTPEERQEQQRRDEVEEAVFLSQFLPRSLQQVVEDYDVQKRVAEDGPEADEADKDFARAVGNLTTARDEESVSESESDDEDCERYVKVPLTPEEQQAAKEALRTERKANKKVVREARTEKRKTKIKKKDKRKAIKKTKGNKGVK